MTIGWNELARQKPHEIVLSGDKLRDEVEAANGQLNELVYKIKSLNFLEIINTPTLKTISSDINKLANLTNLVLHGNQLASVPGEFVLVMMSN